MVTQPGKKYVFVGYFGGLPRAKVKKSKRRLRVFSQLTNRSIVIKRCTESGTLQRTSQPVCLLWGLQDFLRSRSDISDI